MYLKHWGLSRNPFTSPVGSTNVAPTSGQAEALARFDYLATEGQRVGLLVGPSGSGKSTVLSQFVNRVRRRGGWAAELNLSALEPAEFLFQLARGLGVSPESNANRSQLWRGIDDRLAALAVERTGLTVAADDAQNAPIEIALELARLARVLPFRDGGLTLLIAAATPVVAALGTALLEQVDLRVDLERWNLDEVAQYVAAALRAAGGQPSIVPPETISRLFELTQGLPRPLKGLLGMALVVAAAEQLPQITPEIIEAVFEELSLGSPGGAPPVGSSPAVGPQLTATR